MEYAEIMWSLCKEKHANKLERIRRMTTTMVQELERLSYEERIKDMDLTTWEQWRDRGDLIKIYKLLNKIEDVDNKELILWEIRDTINTWDHNKKLRKDA